MYVLHGDAFPGDFLTVCDCESKDSPSDQATGHVTPRSEEASGLSTCQGSSLQQPLPRRCVCGDYYGFTLGSPKVGFTLGMFTFLFIYYELCRHAHGLAERRTEMSLLFFSVFFSV